MTGNVCKCPNPPGGQIICGPNQLAICRINNGKIESECVDPPRDLDGEALTVWIIQRIMRNDIVNWPHLYIPMLLSGNYVGEGQVTFSVPAELMERAGLSSQRPARELE